MILLDTNGVIAFFNRNQEVLKRIQAEIGRIALFPREAASPFVCVYPCGSVAKNQANHVGQDYL